MMIFGIQSRFEFYLQVAKIKQKAQLFQNVTDFQPS